MQNGQQCPVRVQSDGSFDLEPQRSAEKRKGETEQGVNVNWWVALDIRANELSFGLAEIENR